MDILGNDMRCRLSDISKYATASAQQYLQGSSISTVLDHSDRSGLLVWASAAILLGLVGYMLSCFLSAYLRRRARKIHETRIILKVLLGIITPTCSAWPSAFLLLVKGSSSSGSKEIRIPFTLLSTSVCEGLIEFRNVETDLPDLIRNGRQACAFRPIVFADPSLKLKLLTRAAALQAKPSFLGQSYNLRSHQSFNTPLLDYFSVKVVGSDPRSRGRENQDPSCPLYSAPRGVPWKHRYIRALRILSLSPYLSLGASMTAEIERLKSSLPSASPAVLEFLALGPSVTFISDAYLFCAVPCLFGSFSSHLKTVDPSSSCLPLLVTLPTILETFTSGPDAFTIQSIINLSEDRRQFLNCLRKELAEDVVIADAFIAEHGIELWRQDLFLMEWQAALLAAGHIVSWRIVVKR